MDKGCPIGNEMQWTKDTTYEKINKIPIFQNCYNVYNEKDHRPERSPAIKAMDMEWSKKKKEGKSIEMFQPLVDGAIEIIKIH